MSKYTIYIAAVLLLFTACKPSLKPESLYGNWKYIKVEHPDNDPPDRLRKEELDFEKPSIQFAAPDKFLIMWGGKVLSHGTFGTENQTIKIKEALPDGQSREFSFWVTKFTDKDIVFENTTGDKSRVTAVRQ